MALFTWLFLGLIIGSDDLRGYGLQHAGAEALVERGTYDLRGSVTPEFVHLPDVFEVNRRLMAAKQPGQFTISALPYSLLAALGVRYSRHYVWAAAITVWLSSTLATASAVWALWSLLTRRFGFAPPMAARAALCYGLGSTCTAYAGVAHHDVTASALLIWAIYAIESPRRELLAGVLLALVISTSFLPAPITAVLLAYALARARGRWVLAGFVLGVVPLALYNWHYFGRPWLQANMAGSYTDTFFAPDRARFLDHVRDYLGWGPFGVWRFAPLTAAGFFGIVAFPRALGRVRAALLLAVLAHFAYVLNIETEGSCQYGPRYLMPVQALCVLGVAQLYTLAQRLPTVPLFMDALLLGSCVINSVGALGGTMLCWHRTYAFADDLADPSQLMAAEFPLRPLCALALFVLLVVVGVRAWKPKKLTALEVAPPARHR